MVVLVLDDAGCHACEGFFLQFEVLVHVFQGDSGLATHILAHPRNVGSLLEQKSWNKRVLANGRVELHDFPDEHREGAFEPINFLRDMVK